MEWDLINKEKWYEIEEDLGEVTDVSIVKENNMSLVKYKTKGVEKVAYFRNNNLTSLIHSLIYCSEQFK